MSYIKGPMPAGTPAKKAQPLAALAHLAPPPPAAAVAPEPKRIVMPVAPVALGTVPAFDPVQDLAEKATALYLSGNVTFAGRPMFLFERSARAVNLKELSAESRAIMEGYLGVCKGLPALRDRLLLSAGKAATPEKKP
ncbi:MAG: hypothetical protein WC986_14665 [Elusimicrobiota bacterium]|jgi:hypothetical protein